MVTRDNAWGKCSTTVLYKETQEMVGVYRASSRDQANRGSEPPLLTVDAVPRKVRDWRWSILAASAGQEALSHNLRRRRTDYWTRIVLERWGHWGDETMWQALFQRRLRLQG